MLCCRVENQGGQTSRGSIGILLLLYRPPIGQTWHGREDLLHAAPMGQVIKLGEACCGEGKSREET